MVNLTEVLTHHASGFYFVKFQPDWYVVGVTVKNRFADEVKPPGGGGEPGEDTVQTLIREFWQESGGKDGGMNVRDSHIVFNQTVSGHRKVSFLVTQVDRCMVPGEVRKVIEPDKDELEVRLWKIKDFISRLFPDYRKPCTNAVIEKMTIDSEFRKDNRDLIKKLIADWQTEE